MNKFRDLVDKILRTEESFVDTETNEINFNKVKDSADRADTKLISLLVEKNELKEKFFTKINDIYIFNIQDFKFFLDESKVDNSYTQYSNRIGLSDNIGQLENRGDVVLDFPFKDCVLEGGQSTEEKNAKRNEIFFNQVLAHDEIDRLFDRKALVNWKRFLKGSKKEGEKVKEIRRDETGLIQENLVIKGNNLLALHSLKSEFAGKIKLIYIDPPYNTGNDGFKYNDNFNHSTWLTFMKNRLEVAKELLRDDGAIFISIDDNEQAYLKVLMDSIFGKENFIGQFIWHKKLTGGYDNKYLNTQHEYVTFYTKNKDNFNILLEQKESKYKLVDDNGKKYKWDSLWNIGGLTYSKSLDYPIVAPDGSEIWPLGKRGEAFWLWSKDKVERERESLKFLKSKKGDWRVYKKVYASDGIIPGSILDKELVGGNTNSSAEIKKLFDGDKVFDYAKTKNLLKYLFARVLGKNDIVLDYHAGSGTTAHAVLELNKEDGGQRKSIMVEQMDYMNTVTCPRIQKVLDNEDIDDSFVYFELAKWNKKAKEEILATKDLSELINLFDTLYESYFLNYNVKIKDFKEKIIKEENFKNLALLEQKKMFLTMLDLNQMYVSESEISDAKYGVSAEDQKLTKSFYTK